MNTLLAVALLSALSPSVPPSAAVAGTLQVVKVGPPLNALSVPREAVITVEFDQPVDLASLTPQSFHVFGRWSALTPGRVVASAARTRVTFVPDEPFSAGETVYVTLSRSVQSAAGSPLQAGFAWAFWTDSRAGDGRYTQTATLFPGAVPYGAYGGDLEGDGDLDLCIPNEISADVSVFLNDGAGNFSGPTHFAVGVQCSPSEAADFDFDGKLDLAVANIATDDVSILFGNGDGTFQPDVRLGVGEEPRGMTLLDADGDGDADVVTSNRVSGDLSLLLNDGSGVFLPEVRFQGGVLNETGVAACDMNRDGIFDLVVIGYNSDDARVLFGDGNGGFSMGPQVPVGNSPWMVVWGDVNGDGHNDVGAILAGAASAAVVLNDGAGGLLPGATYPAGSFPIALDFGDMDGDGDLDLSTSSYSSGIFTLYHNDGVGAFTQHATLPAVQAASCTVLHDFDGDGDVDVTGIDEVADRVFLFRQDG